MQRLVMWEMKIICSPYLQLFIRIAILSRVEYSQKSVREACDYIMALAVKVLILCIIEYMGLTLR